MPHSNSSHSRHSQPQPGQVVALLLPDLVDCARVGDGLRKTFGQTPGDKRLLVCIPDQNAAVEAWLGPLTGIEVEKQFLLGHELEKPPTDAFVVTAPPDMARDDVIEFALALSDVVLVSAGDEHKPWALHAKKLGKTLVAVGSSLPRLPADPVDVTKGLDPESSGLHSWGRWLFGRLEQFMLECLALLSWGDGKKRRSKVWRSFRSWRPRPYFASDQWKDLCPDKAALKQRAALEQSFEAMDRSAVYGAYIHRDITWIAYFGAAFAVFSAVAGHVFEYPRSGWAELGLLIAVFGGVLFAQRTRLQDRWTACRLGAEQLRIVRMSLPLLVLPPAFATADAEDPGDTEDPIDYEFSAIAQVKRAVRQQGLPHVDYGAVTPTEAARWVQLIVADQMHYHEHNHHTLERAEKSLSAASTFFFVISIALVVVVLLGYHDPRFFLATAAGPAFAAALHGAGTRLGFVHRAALSTDMNKRLKEIFYSLDAVIKSAASSTAAWHDVRALAYAAAEAMGAENTSWHRLVRRYRDELP